MKILLSRILPFLYFVPLVAPALVSGQVQWLSWEDAQARNAREPRKFIVDVYTQWCGWCKKMDKSTFEQAGISAYVNEHFYPVKFDAETKTDIQFKGQTYRYVRSGSTGYHELAAELTFGKLSFPTIVYLDEKLNVIQPIPGFKDPAAMDKILRFFAEDYFRTMPWKKFEEMYDSRPTATPGAPVQPAPPKKD
jgi:thioredoxin-related protein